MFTPEQFSEATKATIDAQLAMFTAFTSKAIESVEEVVKLNLTAAKSSFEESNAAVKQLISAKDVQEVLNLTAAHTQPNTDKVIAYARNLASITSEAQAELTKATEAHVADTSRKVVAFVEEISKNAPAGSENAITLLKSAIGSVTTGYEQINKSTKHAVETMEANLNTAVNQISKTAPRAHKKA